MSNVDINLRTIVRRWLDENFKYSFSFPGAHIFEIAMDKPTIIAGDIRATKALNEREEAVDYKNMFWFGEGNICMVNCHFLNQKHKQLDVSDPNFFHDFASLLRQNFEYLESAGWKLLEKPSSAGPRYG